MQLFLLLQNISLLEQILNLVLRIYIHYPFIMLVISIFLLSEPSKLSFWRLKFVREYTSLNLLGIIRVNPHDPHHLIIIHNLHLLFLWFSRFIRTHIRIRNQLIFNFFNLVHRLHRLERLICMPSFLNDLNILKQLSIFL